MAPKTERFEMRLNRDLQDRVDAWSSQQADRPSRAEAMRRLVERGLEQSEADFRPRNTEKLMLWMLAALLKQQQDYEGTNTAELVQKVIYGGHYWALDWELTGVLHDHIDDRRVVREVVDVLDMWNFIEHGFEQLSAQDKAKVAKEVGPTGKSPQFLGFDGNNETEHMGIAQFLVEKLGRFKRFLGRSFNSHMPTVDRYQNMFRVFEPIRAKLVDRELNADELIQLLRRD